MCGRPAASFPPPFSTSTHYSSRHCRLAPRDDGEPRSQFRAALFGHHDLQRNSRGIVEWRHWNSRGRRSRDAGARLFRGTLGQSSIQRLSRGPVSRYPVERRHGTRASGAPAVPAAGAPVAPARAPCNKITQRLSRRCGAAAGRRGSISRPAAPASPVRPRTDTDRLKTARERRTRRPWTGWGGVFDGAAPG